MYCPVCFTTLQNATAIVLPCGCKHCSECLTSWIIIQTKELHFQTYQKISCMNSSCPQEFKAEDVCSQLSQKQQDAVNVALLDVYLKKTDDIRMCPNNGCSYAGIIDISGPCGSSVECESCGTQWRERVHLSTKEKVKEFFGESKMKRSEILCDLWEEMFARQCPNCGVNIEKSGGCDHMTCRKCQYEFCWLCTQRHHGHNRKFCATAFLIKLILIEFTITHLLWMFGVIQIGMKVVLELVVFALKGAILNALLTGVYLFFGVLKKKKRKIQFLLMIMVIILLGIIHYLSLYVDLCVIFGIEAACLGLVGLYERHMKIWLYSIY